MLNTIIYLIAIFAELLFLMAFTAYIISLVFSSIKGSPYVPTKRKEMRLILKEAKLKKGQTFLEIGSGDGRFVREAVKVYGVKGIGMDVNPLLNIWARFLTMWGKVHGATFKTADILKTDLNVADVMYIFLMPELIKKLEPQITALNKGTLVISHGFRVPYLQKKLVKTIEHSPFPTYFYRV